MTHVCVRRVVWKLTLLFWTYNFRDLQCIYLAESIIRWHAVILRVFETIRSGIVIMQWKIKSVWTILAMPWHFTTNYCIVHINWKTEVFWGKVFRSKNLFGIVSIKFASDQYWLSSYVIQLQWCTTCTDDIFARFSWTVIKL